MAVTYAWRLDTNKYAYLVPPIPFSDISEKDIDSEFTDEQWETYGFLSNTPLTDFFMRKVGTTAENTFGQTENGGDNLETYEKAFGVMLAKIQKAAEGTYYQQLTGDDAIEQFNWSGMRGVDLLSADVYYNIDAKECADLRGVGIKSIQYLGSIEGSTFVEEGSIETGHILTDMRYKVKGSETTVDYVNENKVITSTTVEVQAGIPGFTDVYGIYLEDQIDENGKSTATPEHIFIVRNGQHGIQGAIGPKGDKGDTGSIDIGDGELVDSLSTIDDRLDALESTYATISEFLNNIGGTNISELLSSIQNKLYDLENQVTQLSNRVNELSGNEPGGTTTGSTGGGAIEIYKLRQSEDVNALELTNDWGVTNYGPDEQDGYTFKASGETQLYLLGFLDRKDADGEEGNTYAERLFAIPNIAIESGGITIKGGVRADSITSDYVFADKEMYSKQGYYEIDEFDENYYSGVTEVKLYKEDEAQTTAE